MAQSRLCGVGRATSLAKTHVKSNALYEDAKFGDPKRIEFDPDDLIDAAVEVYLDPRKSSPTIRDPRQFELTLEDLRRRAGIGGLCM